MRSVLGIIGLLLATVLLAGCAAPTRLAYHQSDTLVYWWLDGYVDFNTQQTPKVRDALTALQQWHRSTQLPLYADFLKQLQALAAQNLSEGQACTVADNARTLLMATAAQAEPSLQWLATSLTAQQIDHLQRKYRKTNAAYEKEWRDLPAQALRSKRIEQATGRYEQLYGTLGDEQRKVIEQTIDASGFDASASDAEHQRRQRDIVQTLRSIAAHAPPADQVQALVHALIERSIRPPEPLAQARQSAQWQQACAHFARVHNSTSAAQRAQALQTLKNYEADFRALARPGA